MTIKLHFLGAAGTVTGSKYLLELEGKHILVDCGLFQGFKQLRLRNWAPFPIDPATIDTVLLTHAHLDHSGYLPLLVKSGFRGHVLATPATLALCEILLRDSGYLQERDAEFANRHGYSKHHPALPLYTAEDAETALARFRPVQFNAPVKLGHAIAGRFARAGHILGAAMIELDVSSTRLVFSGDLGRPNDPLMRAPDQIRRADYLVLESTYGDREHGPKDPAQALAEIVDATVARGGTVLIPAFAVGRTQTLLLLLQQLKQTNRIPDVPIVMDSPMAMDASDLLRAHVGDHKLSPAQCRSMCSVARYVRDAEDSKALSSDPRPKIIISASGMATGGRVLHHLKTIAPDPRNTILFAGFQAGGTRGAALIAGATSVKIHGSYVPIAAEVSNLHMLSAHADASEIMAWLRKFEAPPKMTYITHGEPVAADALRHRIEEELGWNCLVPDHGQCVAIGDARPEA